MVILNFCMNGWGGIFKYLDQSNNNSINPGLRVLDEEFLIKKETVSKYE